MKPSFPYRRILLKLSGEALMGSQKFGISQNACHHVALAVKSLHDFGIQIAIVIGGGNIFRGVAIEGMTLPRTPADQIGMLSTLINGIALKQELLALGCATSLMSALACPQVAEAYSWEKSTQYLNEKHIVIFVGGTGNPYFTTDTAAALRASEIQADILLKATKVDGIYDKDPLKNPEARKYDTITYSQILADKLQVMDATSIALCMNNKIPVFVFNMQLLDQKHIIETLMEQQGTIVQGV